jgi:hypothetical protein
MTDVLLGMRGFGRFYCADNVNHKWTRVVQVKVVKANDTFKGYIFL